MKHIVRSIPSQPSVLVTTASFIFVQITVPPTVTPANSEFVVNANQGETVMLSFVLSGATPVVNVQSITWFYSSNFVSNPFNRNVENITNVPNRTRVSNYMFTIDRLNLTIRNFVQTLRGCDDTDVGRYFLVAINPAGVAFSYIDLIVNGKLNHKTVQVLKIIW